ncbi:hypothetical protein Tco_0973594 [Tanacetum coccineum]
MIHDSVLNGPLVWNTIEENGVARPKTYEELSEKEKLQAECDLKATNIFLQALPPDVYSLPEWSKFVTDVKLARGLHATDYDQLYAYLSQHEAHAHEVRVMCEWYPDPLALVANYHHTPSYLNIHHSQYNPPQYQQHLSPLSQQMYSPSPHSRPYEAPHHSQEYQNAYKTQISLAVLSFLPCDDLIACLNKAMAFMSTVMASCFPSTNNQLRTSSNLRNQATIQDGRVTVQQCTQPKRPRNSAWFKEKMLLVQAQESGQVLHEEQLAFLADPGVADGQATQTTITHNAAFQTDDLDAYESDCDDISSAKAVLMANLSSYDSDVLFEVPYSDTYQTDDMINQIVQDTNSSAPQDAMIMSMFEQMSNQNRNEKFDAFQQEIDSLKQTLSKHVKEKESLDIDSRRRETIKMLAKQNDPISKEKKIHISPINYFELNKLFEDFGKRFLPQKQLSAEQAFWLPLSNPNSEQLVVPYTSVKIEVSKELPKESFKDFDNGLHSEINEVKIVFNQLEAAVKQCSVDKKCFDIQKKELFLENDRLLEHIICQDLMNFVMHADSVPVNVLPVNIKYIVHICVNSLATRTNCHEMQQSFIDEYNETSELKAQLAKKEHMVEKTIFNEVVLKFHDLKIVELFEINNLQAKLKAEDVSIANLRKHIKSLKGKNVVEKYLPPNNANVIALGMFRLDLEPLSPKLLKNKDAHIDYIKHTQEHADTLREIVKHARALKPLDSDLNSACKYAKRIQEVLVYVTTTCPSVTKSSEKLVAITPLNKNKKVRNEEFY